MGCRIKYIMSRKIACAGRLYSWYKDTTKYRKPFSYQESSTFPQSQSSTGDSRDFFLLFAMFYYPRVMELSFS